MRKFFYLFVAVIGMMVVASCTSCTNDTPWGVEYSLTSDGKTDGSVCVTFINGSFDIHGDANYQFEWSSAPIDSTTVSAFKVGNVKSLNNSLVCLDNNEFQAAVYVKNWLDNSIGVKSYEGHYDIYVKGYVKETKSQITFSIDRHFTNIPDQESEVDTE